LGIAHGWAGLLYATLRWCQASRTALPPALEQRLHQLAECAEPAGQGVCWPRQVRRRRGGEDAWTGWCNGSAGYVYLWTLAHQVFRDESFLKLAHQAAWHAWQGREMGSNLCCGTTGSAYALLNLYKCSGDKDWLDRARELGERAVADVASPGLLKNSLYKGDVGMALLVADLAEPTSSCMPLFEGEGWPRSG
jgi:serine/threonine-protein kinase